MSKSESYWKKRFQALEDASNTYGQQTFMKIEPAFDKAQRTIQSEIESWYGRFAKNNNITMQEARKLLNTKELKEFRWDVKEYIKYGMENDLNQAWMKELENASARVHINRLEALKIRTQHAAEVAFGNELDCIDTMARKVFTEDYYHTIYEVQKGFGIGWEIGQIDERKLETLISKPWAADGKNFSQRIWGQRSQLVDELHTQLTRTCILGKAPDDAINAIAKKFNTTKNQAGRLVMTEQAYFHSVAQQKAFDDLDVEEFEIVATLDSSTSEICQEMDGKHFPMKDYQPGVTAPPFHVWCRSVTVPWFEDNYTGERAARDVDGNTYYVPDKMTYADWKKSMVDGDTSGLTIADNSSKIDLKSKIQKVKNDIAANGGVITEAHLKEAGEAVQDELLNDKRYKERNQKVDDLTEQKHVAYKKYKDASDELRELKNQNPELGKAIDRHTSLEWWVENRPDNPKFAQELKEVEEKIRQIKPDYFDVKKRIEELYDEYSEISASLRDLKVNFEYDNAEDVKRILSQVREMGSDGIDIKSHLCKSKSSVAKYVDQAYSYYPTDWVKTSVNHGTMKPKKVQRGYYGGSEIAISGDGVGAFSTSLHELGHRMEEVIPEIKKAEKVFYARRTDGEDLKWLGSGYGRNETTRKDNFLHPYMGKDYGGSWYELVSMGFEYGYTNPAHLMKDPDMSTWIYGILTLH